MLSIWAVCIIVLVGTLLANWNSLSRNKTCSRAFDNLNRWSARAIDSTCSQWVDEGIVTWEQIESDIAHREWLLVWSWPGFEEINSCNNLFICDGFFVRAMTLSSRDWMEMRLRDPDDVSIDVLTDDIVHEMSHFVLFAGGYPAKLHHPMMEARPWVPSN